MRLARLDIRQRTINKRLLCRCGRTAREKLVEGFVPGSECGQVVLRMWSGCNKVLFNFYPLFLYFPLCWRVLVGVQFVARSFGVQVRSPIYLRASGNVSRDLRTLRLLANYCPLLQRWWVYLFGQVLGDSRRGSPSNCLNLGTWYVADKEASAFFCLRVRFSSEVFVRSSSYSAFYLEFNASMCLNIWRFGILRSSPFGMYFNIIFILIL